MPPGEYSCLKIDHYIVPSALLGREVIVDCYFPKKFPVHRLSLLLINDGQDLEAMVFPETLNRLLENKKIGCLFCVGIHAGKDRTNEYGTAAMADYEGRGSRASVYNRFVLEELVPFIRTRYHIISFDQLAVAGFSLGGLTAMDMVWNHPGVFSTAGVFSGSLWWRSKALGADYDDDRDRIMHQQVRKGTYHPGLRFYFTTGSLDETADRNNNGIIDSIDDTLDLVKELKLLGYTDREISYTNYEDGKHDVETWGRALQEFLLWGWGRQNK